MLRINGVGATKWERYGDEVLALVTAGAEGSEDGEN